jgi:hypothetical protein
MDISPPHRLPLRLEASTGNSVVVRSAVTLWALVFLSTLCSVNEKNNAENKVAQV